MATSTAYGGTALALMIVALAPAAATADRGGAPECRYCPTYSGATGSVEAGVGYQDEDSAPFGRYTGLDDDGAHAVLNGRLRYRGEGAGYLEAEADDLGLDSRRLLMEGGSQGRFGLAVEYDEIPNYRDRTSFSPLRGDSRLVLPAGWVRGATTSNLPTLAGDLKRTELETQRDALGVGFSFLPRADWEVFGSVRREEKDGTRDLGATFGFSQTVILPAPVDYETDAYSFGVGYQGEDFQFRLAYDGSVFRNDDSAITWDNPFLGGDDRGRLAGAPDNEHHQVSATLGYALGEATRLNARFAVGRMTQDDNFLPYAINPGLTAPGGTPATSLAALPARDLDGEVDTRLAEFRVTSRPTPRLRLSADFTHSDRDNDTDRLRFARVDPSATDNTPPTRVNTPYGFTQNLFRVKAAYRLPGATELQAGADYDKLERSFQAVEETEDVTAWGRVRFRPTDSVEASFKVSHAERDASGYDPVAHLTAFDEVQNPRMRVHNLTDRKRDKVSGSLSWMMTPAITVAAQYDYYRDDYDEGGGPAPQLGLTRATGRMVSVDASFRIRENLSASAFFTNDRMESDQAGQGFFVNDWTVEDRYNTDTAGLGLNWSPLPGRLDLAADLTYSEFRGDIDYPSGGRSYPGLETEITTFNLRGDYHLDDRSSLVFRWRYEHYDEDDFAKDGIVNTLPTVLDLGREGYDDEAVMGSVAYRYRFD